jgi:F0F1-type ATP synthase assembly protein I
LIVGGAISWYVSTRSKDKALNTARQEKGTLLASGFIAGGALMGVVSAALRFGGIDVMNAEWVESASAEWLSLVMYGAVIGYFVWDSMRIKQEDL